MRVSLIQPNKTDELAIMAEQGYTNGRNSHTFTAAILTIYSQLNYNVQSLLESALCLPLKERLYEPEIFGSTKILMLFS